MKLVRSKLANADTITTDDGVVLGMIYYGTQPVTDDGKTGRDLFHEWWELHERWENLGKRLTKLAKADDPDAPSSAG